MIVPAYYEDLHTSHVGCTPNRAYYIPASVRMDDLAEHRESSDRFQLLNGDWKFCYCESIHDLREAFYEKDYDASSWGTIPVPGVWQNFGYDSHQYTNVRYPFPADPPYVPCDNPCGAYLHEFDYITDEKAPRAFLNFEGVDSCFYVWLNGEFLGYSQVSHSTSEFDVSGKVRNGRNRLAVLVLKWCDGSYLEDQDKFRTTGIFRDVYILKRSANCVRDYFVTTHITGDAAEVKVRFAYDGKYSNTAFSVLDGDKLLCSAEPEPLCDEAYNYQARLEIKEPILWNPEQPYLYTLLIETENEVITESVGLREIHIENNQVFLNGRPIKFRGVNRHDSDPVTGPVISVEHMKRDLAIIKEHNFNAIRTSHYPNAPMFYQLCDRYGFMVIDEADHESHGAQELYLGENISWEERAEHWNELFADNPDYIEATVDRAQRCIHRDKNRPCVLVWSMGNESAYGCCFEAALTWTKSFDPDRLSHYESAQYHSHKRKYDFSNIDLYSDMYSSLERLQNYVDSEPDKPFLLCEYAHAMGNGPGDLEDYWQFIQAHDEMCGGFVWEFCDHAVFAGHAANGKPKYLYGGDHGEYPHDGNFCVDGLVYPDRRPHTGLLEYKNIHRPARITAFDQDSGRLCLHNYMDFVALCDYVDASWELSCDGHMVSNGLLDVPAIPPHADGSAIIEAAVPETGRCFLRVKYFLKNETELLPKDFELGYDEIALENADGRNRKALSLWQGKRTAGSPLSLEESERYITVNSANFSYVYDKFRGSFKDMSFNDTAILESPMELNIWRAPTDNDRKLKLRWMAAYYDRVVTRAYSTSSVQSGDGFTIHSALSVSAASVQRIMDVEIDWTVSACGAVTAKISVKRNMKFPELPRFGLRLFVPGDFENVTYYGLGPMENYVDKRGSAYHGLFENTVTGLHEDYIRPQENGARGDCDYVCLENRIVRLNVTGPEPFSFNASHYTQEELTAKAHNFELEESGCTVLCLDYRQNGIGSNSCGPELLDKYRFDDERFDFTVKIVPEMK